MRYLRTVSTRRLLATIAAVLAIIAAGTAIAVAASGFVGYAPNRLVSGRPIALWAAAPGLSTGSIAVLGAMLLAACFATPGKTLHLAEAGLAAALLLLVLAAAGEAASLLAQGARPAVRISLGAAFWVLAAGAVLAIVDALQRLGAGPWARGLPVVVIGVVIVGLALGGTFDSLSIAREYTTRRQLFVDALTRHMALVAGSVGPAIVIGFPLGAAAVRRPRLQGPLFAVLNTLQTIPSIALFGLLIVPLAALAAAVPQLAGHGIGGIGLAPAIIALLL